MRGVFSISLFALGILMPCPWAAGADEREKVFFADGLSMRIPEGWHVLSKKTEKSPRAQPPTADDPDLPELVLHVSPVDGREANLSVLRAAPVDETSGTEVKGAVFSRLHESAGQAGYKVNSAASQGSPDGSDHAVLCEVSGLCEGRQRIFKALAIHQFPNPTYYCYWQYDKADRETQEAFDQWLATVFFQGTRIENVFAGKAEIPGPKDTDESGEETPSKTAGETDPFSLPKDMAPSSPEVNELAAQYSDALVVVKGKNGVGSGFICTMDGQPWLVTNIHVLAGNPEPRFLRINGDQLELGEAVLGVEHDICKIALPSASSMLDMQPVEAGTVNIGDRIAVLGNAEGAGVIKPLEGRIVGIGPNLIEVDAPFVPGNSGSPIIHLPTGKVIAIATYLTTRTVNTKAGRVTTNARRFGYRIDSVKNWEPLQWPRFYAQSEQVNRIQAAGEDFIKLFDNAREKTLDPSDYQHPGIRRALDTFQSRFQASSRMSESDTQSAVRELLGNLRVATRSDIASFNVRTAYDYFRGLIADEQKFRDEVYEGFTRSLEGKNR